MTTGQIVALATAIPAIIGAITALVIAIKTGSKATQATNVASNAHTRIDNLLDPKAPGPTVALAAAPDRTATTSAAVNQYKVLGRTMQFDPHRKDYNGCSSHSSQKPPRNGQEASFPNGRTRSLEAYTR